MVVMGISKPQRMFSVRNPSVFQMPLRGRGGRRTWYGSDVPSDCVYEFITGHKEQLASEVHCCRMYRHGICIWVIASGPEKVCEKPGDGQGDADLPKEVRPGNEKRVREGKMEDPYRNAKEEKEECNKQERNIQPPYASQNRQKPDLDRKCHKEQRPYDQFEAGFFLVFTPPVCGGQGESRRDTVERCRYP